MESSPPTKKERRYETNQRYYAKHGDELKAKQRAYYQRTREAKLAKMKEYYANKKKRNVTPSSPTFEDIYPLLEEKALTMCNVTNK